MFEKITPEQAGIPSKVISNFLDILENCEARTHGLLFMKDGKIFAEGYYKPFNKDFCHRMYSQTKSFVGVAIGLLEEEGKLKLNDKIIDYFPEKIDGELPEYLSEQTIEHMLTMTTVGEPSWWFAAKDKDRVHQYFNEKREKEKNKVPGTLWEYDSAGSQVLCALVEKLSGKTLLEYLKEKLFNEMGVFKTAKILKTPSGESWGDSGMICRLRDVAAFGQFVMNYGVWNGKRLMNENYLKRATSKIVDNREEGFYSYGVFGYGYQIWRVGGNGFAFIGMGDQITICYPDKNFIFSCISCNQGTTYPRNVIFTAVRDYILPNMSDTPIEEDVLEQNKLYDRLENLSLYASVGNEDSPYREKINKIRYVCDENPMGISEFTFVFKDKTQGEFLYKNKQGEKVIPFGVNHNVFGKFPQYGYSQEVGGLTTTNGHLYDDAVSFAWLQENKIILNVQIIDDYFGNMSAIFAFNDNKATARFSSAAENFLFEYKGLLTAVRQK